MIWYKENNNDIAVSTRIRFARNIESIPFPNALADTSKAVDMVKNSVLNSNSTLADDFEFFDLNKISETDKIVLQEKHLISPQMLRGSGKAVLINKHETMSIMLMEEDHIRLQIIESGLEIDKCYEIASKVDDVIEESLSYAFDEEFGYLTACPTNAGTGLRASVMMHLPALTMSENMSKVIASASSLGIAVRGLYGEGTKAYGNLYQISNQTTMGISEKEILEKLKNIVNQIMDMETQMRQGLKEKNYDEISDKVFRSYGILKYARRITSIEAKSLLSDVMLGQNMGILPTDGKISPLECMVESSPALMAKGENTTAVMRDIERAKMIRENI